MAVTARLNKVINMTTRTKVKIAVDIAMTVELILLMGHMATGDLPHEIIGTCMIVLWIIHNVLSMKWYYVLPRGKYSVKRTLNTVINLLLVLAASGIIVSSIILSSYVFTFLGIENGMSFARKLHLVCVYWFFVLSSMHLGLHWSRVASVIGKRAGVRRPKVRSGLLNAAAVTVSCFGVYAFFKQQIASYMFMRTLFVFFDFEQSKLLFFAEYIGMMVFFASAAYYISLFPAKRKQSGELM